jgi:hypothetical protein
MGVRFAITDGSAHQLAQILLASNETHGEWCQESGSLAIGRLGRGRYGWVQQTSRLWLFEPGTQEGTAVFVLRMQQVLRAPGALAVGDRGPCDVPSSSTFVPTSSPSPKGSSRSSKGATDPRQGGVSPSPPPPGPSMLWIVMAINVADNCTGRGRQAPRPGWFEGIQRTLQELGW